MGAGASAAEGRVFCHHCGTRSVQVRAEVPRCSVCGATEGVEMTDSRLPVTSSPSGGSRGSAVRGSGVATPNPFATSSTGLRVPHEVEEGHYSMRVESVTVMAMQRPEEGDLVLRVFPNVVRRPEVATPATVSAEAEDWETPEPACCALVSRLDVRSLSMQEASGLSVAGAAGGLCVICADNMAEAGTPVVVLSCGHTFHDACIRQWLGRRHTCPTCRLELEVDGVKYLRSLGLADEADALEKVEQEKAAKELEKQAIARRRWVESMRRGDAVHFGLVCTRCSVTPLIGECYRCQLCQGYILCSDCYAQKEASLLSELLDGDASTEAAGSSSAGEDGAGRSSDYEDEHPADHLLLPFGMAEGGLTSGTPTGPGGLLTVLVRAQQQEQAEASGEAAQSAAEAGVTAAEVALAAVRSLASAPLALQPAPLSTGAVAGRSSPRRGRWSLRGRPFERSR